jgi:hypothetical protein
MSTRRFVSTIVPAAVCVLACALTGAAPAGAVTHFGSAGKGSGRFSGPAGVAVEQETGNVFVADQFNLRVDEFTGSGGFVMAWGQRVNEVAPAKEFQTCTTFCEQGEEQRSGSGGFAGEGPRGVAVDNDPLSSSYGDVYVVDFEGFRVEKYDSSGKFLLMFGGGVNATTGGNVCVAGEACKDGTLGILDGQFEWAYRGSYIAVGPGGAVYVGDRARVEVFEPSGAWRENISLAGLSSTSQVTALAVDASGDMFVKDREVSGVRELEPNGIAKATQFDAGSESVEALALDGSGDLFVGDSSGGFPVLEYGPAGEELSSFGSKTVTATQGMAFADGSGQLYVGNFIEESDVWILTPPPPGPLVEPGSVSASPGERGRAGLEATIDPEGSETAYRFEYVTEANFQADGYAGASSTSPVSIASGLFEDHPANTELTGLVPGDTYHYRVVATSSKGTTSGPDQTFTEVPSALIVGPWASDLAATSVTLAAEINPLGSGTEYRLEYGTSTAYGQTLSGTVEGTSSVPVSYHRQGLSPSTTYHYRLVTHNEVGTIEGPDHTFTTQPASVEPTLVDGRAWELVSLPEKKGALIEPSDSHGPVQAASDGSQITYTATEPLGENVEGRSNLSQVLSSHGPAGWVSESINVRRRLAKEGEASISYDYKPEYRLFSTDLSFGVIDPPPGNTTILSPEVTNRTLYLRDDSNKTYIPLVTNAMVPPGTEFGNEGISVSNAGGGSVMQFLGATPDLSHVAFGSAARLTPELPVQPKGVYVTNLFEWSGGKFQLVNILPDGSPSDGATLGVIGLGKINMAAHTISNDGRWILWTDGEGKPRSNETLRIYIRDMVAKKTLPVGGQYARLGTMSSDGSRVFYLEGGDLHELDTETDSQTDLTADHGAGEDTAGVKNTVVGASEDGSYVYFVATGVLADGASSGADNLYVARDTASGWKITYITTLSGEDEKDWWEPTYPGQEVDELRHVTSRVSPDGRYVAFMSDRSLTGYDNRDAISGQPDQEVYLFDAVDDRLVCVSCDPTGARPVGLLDEFSNLPLIDLVGASASLQGSGRKVWLAGNVPGWNENEGVGQYQPRYLSDSGRLFFQSPDALVPQDTNGVADVYEYEPLGVGSCTMGTSMFSKRDGGCVSLVSSGTSAQESALLDASETGDDVFFVTASRLTAADYDNTYDVYDAHVCSSAAPCTVLPVLPPACTSGDSCKAAPAPQPEIFGPTPSATFSGRGNVVEEAKSVGKPKVRKKPKRRRVKEKRRAKRARGSRSVGTIGKGGKR